MARKNKDRDWNDGPDSGDSSYTADRVNRAILLDIRDELKALNRVLGCWRFQGMPKTISTIDKRLQVAGMLTTKKRRKRKVKK